MLSPEVLASQLAEAGQEVIVHVACRDRNRNELLSLVGASRARGSTTYSSCPATTRPRGTSAWPARSLTSTRSASLLCMKASTTGRFRRDVVGRPIPRDRARTVPALGPARGNGTAVAPPTSFYLGVAVNPFKRVERDLVPQYAKLAFKARMGARFAITQVGYDPRKLDELVRFVAEIGLPLRLLANVFVLSRTTARIFHAGEIPGVAIPDALAERAEREGASAGQGQGVLSRARGASGGNRARPRIRGRVPRGYEHGPRTLRRSSTAPRRSGPTTGVRLSARTPGRFPAPSICTLPIGRPG